MDKIKIGNWTVSAEMEGRRIVASLRNGPTHYGTNYGDGSVGFDWPECIPKRVLSACHTMADRYPEERIQAIRGDKVEQGIPLD
jgi:hypothetical protein